MTPRIRIPFSTIFIGSGLLTLFVDASLFGRPTSARLGVYMVITLIFVLAYESLPQRRIARRCARRRRRGQCVHCGYDLRHAAHERCPECGTAPPSPPDEPR